MTRLKAFVAGPPRSGTTMLQLLLQNKAVPEATYLSNLINGHHQAVRVIERERFDFYFGSLSQCHALYREITDKFINAIQKDLSDGIILKCPEMTRCISSFRDIYPDVPLFVVLRDPRAIYASLKSVFVKQGMLAIEENIIPYMLPHFEGIAYYKANRKKQDHIHFVRYEDVVTGKTEEFQSLAKKYNLSLSSQPNTQKKFDKSNPYYSDLYGKPVTDERLNSYMIDLTSQEIEAVERNFGSFMLDHGYSPIQVKKSQIILSGEKNKFHLRIWATKLLIRLNLYNKVRSGYYALRRFTLTGKKLP